MAAQLLRSGTSPLFETEPKRTNTILMVGLQGFIGGLTLLVIFTAVEYVPLHNGSAIFFCTPVLFDYFFLFSSWILHWIKKGNFIWRPFAENSTIISRWNSILILFESFEFWYFLFMKLLGIICPPPIGIGLIDLQKIGGSPGTIIPTFMY